MNRLLPDVGTLKSQSKRLHATHHSATARAAAGEAGAVRFGDFADALEALHGRPVDMLTELMIQSLIFKAEVQKDRWTVIDLQHGEDCGTSLLDALDAIATEDAALDSLAQAKAEAGSDVGSADFL